MFPYFVLFFIIIILYLFCKDCCGKEYIKKYNFIIAIIFILFISFRNEKVGADIVTYKRWYLMIENQSFSTLLENRQWEIGYIVLNKILNIMFSASGFRVMLVIVAVFAIVPIALFINQYSKMPWLSWLLYLSLNYLIYPMSGLRACIAMSFGVLSFKYLWLPVTKKNVSCFYLFAILACGFHTTAVVYLFLYPMCKIKSNWIIFSFFIIFAGIFLFFGDRIIIFLIKTFYPSYQMESAGGYGLLIFLIGCVIAGLLFVPKSRRKDNANQVLFRIICCCLVLQLLTLKFSLFSRVVEFFLIACIVYIPYVISVMEYNKNIAMSAVVIGAFLLLYLNLQANGANIVPYAFF